MQSLHDWSIHNDVTPPHRVPITLSSIAVVKLLAPCSRSVSRSFCNIHSDALYYEHISLY